jgi:hypothetical protein
MDWKRITFIFVLSMAISVLAYDGFVMLKAGYEASVSHTVIIMAYKYPVMTFLVGFVCGHLFWRMGASKETDQIDKLVHGDGR